MRTKKEEVFKSRQHRVNSMPQQSNSMTEVEAQQVGPYSHAFAQLVSRVSAEVTNTIAPLLAPL